MKLDLGCGPNKKGPDWIGVDVRSFPGVDTVLDLREPWPWPDNSVDEAHSSHFIEHLDAPARIHFANELWRVLKPGAKALIIAPHWSAARAYGDLTHAWPPVSEFWFFYLDANWRAAQAPHNDQYTCDFIVNWGYSLRPDLHSRNLEYQQFAMSNYKEACQDIMATFEKKLLPAKT